MQSLLLSLTGCSAPHAQMKAPTSGGDDARFRHRHGGGSLLWTVDPVRCHTGILDEWAEMNYWEKPGRRQSPVLSPATR